MGLIAEVSIEDLPVNPTLLWGGIPLFDAGDGLKLLDYCKDNGIAVLGLEGFKVEGGNRVPDMDCIVDFSAPLSEFDFAAKSLEASRLIIERMSGSGVFMEFVLVRI